MTSEDSSPGVGLPTNATAAVCDGIRARGLASFAGYEETEDRCGACEGTGAEPAYVEVPCHVCHGNHGACEECGGCGVETETRWRRLRPLDAGEEFISAVLALDDEVDFARPLDDSDLKLNEGSSTTRAAWDRLGRAVAAIRASRTTAVQPEATPLVASVPSDPGLMKP